MGQIRALPWNQVADTSREHSKEKHMNINSDGAEIDPGDIREMQVYGDWIKFVDGEGAAVKITPGVVKQLMIFALEHVNEFEEGAWE
jgi:hypothetical protein